MTSPLRGAALLAAIAAVGNLLLAIAHLGIEIPVLSALGPQGGATVPPAVVAFTIGTTVFTAIAVGLVRRRRWAWFGGMAVSLLAVLSGVGQFRGVVSALGIALAVALAALLLTPSGRRDAGIGAPAPS